MSTITNTSAANSTSNPTVSNSKSAMGKDDFLKLMIAQMKNQDPLNPMDGTQYAAQLAQFSSLEQLTNLNDSVTQSINANYTLTQSINNTLVANLIGKQVKVSGGNLQISGQDSMTLGYDLPSEAKSVQINVYNSSGALVRTIDDIPTTEGTSKLSWDLSDNNGDKLPNGKYTFEVKATSTSGESMTVDIFKEGIIEGVRYTSNGTAFVVDGSEYSLSDISEIINTPDNGGGK